jgi:hypothetical protein
MGSAAEEEEEVSFVVVVGEGFHSPSRAFPLHKTYRKTLCYIH